MALLDRISGVEGVVKIANHQFQASLHLWQLGLLTRANIINSFNISPTDEGDLDFLKTKYVAALNKIEYIKGLDSVIMCAEQGRYGLNVQATFISAVDALALIPA